MNSPTRHHRNWIPGICGRAVSAGALALALLLGLAARSVQAQTFTTFDVSGAGTGALQGTFPISINTAGTIAGTYLVAGPASHGFVRAANGTITDIDITGAGTGKNQGTIPVSINTAGTITGMSADASNVYHGFVRSSKGTITDIEVTGAGTGGHQGTMPMSINTAGAITGMYKDTNSVYHGFVRATNGTITPFDAPGAGTAYSQGTMPMSINTAGIIVGMYADASHVYHCFERAADGSISDINVTGATGTACVSIDGAGVITGAYLDASNVFHGFVRAANGTISSFDAPGAASGPGKIQGTIPLSINTAGVIGGSYTDSSYVAHGFVRAANGTITDFDVPGASSSALLTLLPLATKGPPDQGTAGFSINAGGVITGTYFDTSAVAHGFVRTPPAATTTTLTSSPNPSTSGQAVTFTARVTSKAGTPPDGETVSFMEGKTVLGTGTLSSGSTTFTTSTLKVGTDTITAVYGGDPKFASSKSKALKQVVNAAAE